MIIFLISHIKIICFDLSSEPSCPDGSDEDHIIGFLQN